MTSSRARTIGRLGRVIAVPALVLLGTLATASPISAHHATVAGSATCSDGRYVIDWSSRSWVATDGTTDSGGRASAWRGLNQHPGISVSYRVGRHGSFTPVEGVHTLTADTTTPVVIRGRARHFPAASSSFELPGDTAGRLTLRVTVGPWGPDPKTGRYTTLGPSTRESAPIRLSGECGQSSPAAPAASADSICVDGQPVIRVTLANDNDPGGDPFTFAVSAPASGSQPPFSATDITVPGGGSTTVDVPVDEGDSRTITVDGDGFTQALTGSGDCSTDPVPRVLSIEASCSDGVGVIRTTLQNDNGAGGQPVTFEVASPASGGQPAFAASVTVPGGGTEEVDIPATENDTRTVTVDAPGMTTRTESVTLDCVPAPVPNVAFEAVCSPEGAVRARLSNDNGTGGESVTFQVTSPSVGAGYPAIDVAVTVAGGDDAVVDAPAPEGTARTITVSAPGLETVSGTRTVNCTSDPNPMVVSVEPVCEDTIQVIRATIRNDNGAGGQPVDMLVTSVATGQFPAFSALVTVEGGATRIVDIPADEDTARTIVISAPGMATQTFTVTLDCVPAP